MVKNVHLKILSNEKILCDFFPLQYVSLFKALKACLYNLE